MVLHRTGVLRRKDNQTCETIELNKELSQFKKKIDVIPFRGGGQRNPDFKPFGVISGVNCKTTVHAIERALRAGCKASSNL